MNQSLSGGVNPDTTADESYMKTVVNAVSRALRRLRDWPRRLHARWGGFAILSRADLADRAALLAAAEAGVALWKAHAAALEEHIETLEGRIDDSERVALGLRARLVCMHGKLATTAATARYQSFTMALESRARGGRGPDGRPLAGGLRTGHALEGTGARIS